MANTPERHCKGTSIKTGLPCKANPMKDTPWCSAHNPELPESARFGSRAQAAEAAKLGGRPKNPRVVDILKERFEEEVDEWIEVLREARDAKEPYTVGWGEDAFVEMVPDHKTRIVAFREAADRVYGKPRQTTEITGPGGGPLAVTAVDLRNLSDEDVTALRGLLAKAAGE